MTTLLIAYLVSLIGVFSHWFKRYIRAQTSEGFAKYMTGHWKYSVSCLVTLFGAVAALLATTGTINLNDAATLAQLIAAGYTVDSMTNKGKS